MKIASKLLVGIAGMVAAASSFADAATDAAITGAMTAAGVSVGTYGAALVTLSLFGVGFAVGIKYVKKIPRVS